MTTELLQRHLAKVEQAEEAEAAVYRAALVWAPEQRKGNEAKGKLGNANLQVQLADADFNRVLREISDFDPELGRVLFLQHNAGTLSRESIGEGGGKRVKDVLNAETALRKARDGVKQASQQCSQANGKANLLYRDVLLALDALKPHVSGEQLSGVLRVFSEANKDPDRVAEQCKTRLEALKA